MLRTSWVFLTSGRRLWIILYNISLNVPGSIPSSMRRPMMSFVIFSARGVKFIFHTSRTLTFYLKFLVKKIYKTPRIPVQTQNFTGMRSGKYLAFYTISHNPIPLRVWQQITRTTKQYDVTPTAKQHKVGQKHAHRTFCFSITDKRPNSKSFTHLQSMLLHPQSHLPLFPSAGIFPVPLVPSVCQVVLFCFYQVGS